MLRKSIIVMLILMAFVPVFAVAPDQFGLGIMLGDPTGLSGKYWTTRTNAIDMGIAWSFRDDTRLQLHADYLFHFPIRQIAKQSPLFYAGVGGYVKVADKHDSNLGVRVPFGLIVLPRKTPLEIFIEVVPVMNLAPETDGDIQAAFGLRYYFP